MSRRMKATSFESRGDGPAKGLTAFWPRLFPSPAGTIRIRAGLRVPRATIESRPGCTGCSHRAGDSASRSIMSIAVRNSVAASAGRPARCRARPRYEWFIASRF